MCEPATIALISTGISVATASIGYMGQEAAASAQTARYEQNAGNALVAFTGDIEANNLNAMANQEAAGQRKLQASSEGLYNRSLARVSAGERGIGGLTAAALEADLGFQEGSQVSAVNRNAELDQQRYRLSAAGAHNSAVGRINSMAPGQKPSLLALGAQFGQAALNGYTMYNDLSAQRAAMAGVK